MQKSLPGIVPEPLAGLAKKVDGLKHGMTFLQYFADRTVGKITVRESPYYRKWGMGEEDYDVLSMKIATARLGPDTKYQLELRVGPGERVWMGLILAEAVLEISAYRIAFFLYADGSMVMEQPPTRPHPRVSDGMIQVRKEECQAFVQMHRELSDLCVWE